VTRYERLAVEGILARDHPAYELERTRRVLESRLHAVAILAFAALWAVAVLLYLLVACMFVVSLSRTHGALDWMRVVAALGLLSLPFLAVWLWLRRLVQGFAEIQSLEREIPPLVRTLELEEDCLP